MKVLDQLDAAASASNETVRNQAMEEGRKLLKERNKHIQLAEKYGWEAADCYVQEPLACDSDDEKRIKQAVKESKPQREKHTKRASQPRLNCDIDIDWNYDCDALEASKPGLIDMYNEFGLTEHELKDDINSNFVDLAAAHSSYAPSCSSGDSPREGSVCVKGRLKDHLSFWHAIKANQWVISIIRDGYALPFVELPPRKQMENHKSAADEKEFVAEQVKELLLTGCVTKVNRADIHIVSPLGVVKNSVKKRLILDLKFVNKYLGIPKFKYEDIRTVRDIFALCNWFFKFDYKSGYHHVDILPNHQKFLGFSWTLVGEKKWFAFTVLPFSLASATYVFSKIQKALVKHWREQGIRIFTYLDDRAGADGTLEAARAESSRVKADVAPVVLSLIPKKVARNQHKKSHCIASKDLEKESILCRWPNPCTGVDAFTLSWSGENNWIFPPPYLIPRVLQHLEHGMEFKTLIIPLWTSASCQPLVTRDGTQPTAFVQDWVEIPPSEDMFIPVTSGAPLFSGKPSYHVFAIQVSFAGPAAHTAKPFFQHSTTPNPTA
ncbi:hypothetical protein ACROYT_G023375 [Oculina patagonica]